MKKHSDPPDVSENLDDLRAKIIGLGERSARKSHYPELRVRLAELERAQRTLQFLADAGAAVSSSLDLETTLSNLEKVALPELGDLCVVYRRGHSGAIRQIAVLHADARDIAAARALAEHHAWGAHAEHVVTRVIDRGGGELLADLGAAAADAASDDAAHLSALRELGLASMLVVPYDAGPRSSGALLFATVVGSRPCLDAFDLEVARQLAQRVAMALEHARLYNEAQEASRLKDDFLAIVSHELCTPLTAILGWANRLASGRLGEMVIPRAAASIERNARALGVIIDNLLDVSRMAANQLDVRLSPMELAPVVQAAADAARPAMAAKQLAFDVSIARDVPPILGHARRLSQVVTNLLTNAIKFTPPGGRIELALLRREDGAEILVRDTGCGIRPDLLPHVFERFRQDQGVVDRGRAGLGLGLAIVRHIVELHDGEVHATSPGEGLGACFEVIIPYARGEALAGPCGVTCTECSSEAD